MDQEMTHRDDFWVPLAAGIIKRAMIFSERPMRVETPQTKKSAAGGVRWT